MHAPDVIKGNAQSPVAICTLSSQELLKKLRESPIAQQVAMIGPLETENLGIERMLTTLLRDPLRDRRSAQLVQQLPAR